jgi:hypothetical protein
MRRLISLLSLLFILNNFSDAQTPQGFKYQAVVRDNSGLALTNKLVAIRLSLLLNSTNGTSVYSEVHNIATNDFGVANLNVGAGTNTTGNFANIDWGAGTYFLKTEADITNGNNFVFLGTSQLLSVPYAMYAAKSANAANDFDKDSLNELQNLNVSNNKLSITKGNQVNIDADTANEIQTLTLTNNNLQLNKNGGSVDLTKYDKDSQQLVLNGNTLSITKGNSIVLSGAVDLDSDPTNEIQLLTLKKDTISLSKANYIVLPKDNDADSTNEIQTLTYKNDTIQLSKANNIVLPKDNDRDSLNELQLLSRSNDTIFLSKGNFIVLPNSYSPIGVFSLNNIKYNSNRYYKLLDSGQSNYTTPDFGNCVIFDSLGNFYFAGSYTNPIIIDGVKLINTNATSSGFFLVKYNKFGVKQWLNNYPNTDKVLMNFIIDNSMDIVLLLSANHFNSPSTNSFIYKVSSGGINLWNKTFSIYSTWTGGGTHRNSKGICVDKQNFIYIVNTTDNINGNQQLELLKINPTNGSNTSNIITSASGSSYGWIQFVENIFSDDSNNIYIISGYNGARNQNLQYPDNKVLIRVNASGGLAYINFNGLFNSKIYQMNLNSFIAFGRQNSYNAIINLQSGGDLNIISWNNINLNPILSNSINNNSLKFNIQNDGFIYFDDNHIYPQIDGFQRNFIVETSINGYLTNLKGLLTRNSSLFSNTVVDNNGKCLFLLGFPFGGFANINGSKIGNDDSLYLIE